MADGDNAASPILKSVLSDRKWPPKTSYFFSNQVQKCYLEQYKVLRAKLAEKETEAQISYDKCLSDNFGGGAQVDSVFMQLLFDSDTPVNLNLLIDELRLLAGKESIGQDVTRLLDLLFVTRNTSSLLEELTIRNATYDLYEADATGKFGSVATCTTLMRNARGKELSGNNAQMAMVLSMLVTDQQEIILLALMYMAKALSLPWDALVLARYIYGKEHEVTRMVQELWSEAVMADDSFPMIKITRSLDNSNLKEVAGRLKDGASNKKTVSELLDAYRCLVLATAPNSSRSELERKLELAEVSKKMRNLFVSAVGWGRTNWARIMLIDVSKRAPPGDIPSDVCEIGLRCFIDLVDILHKLTGLALQDSDQPATSLKKTALAWRMEINRKDGDMNKLKLKDPGAQKIMYEWIQQLAAAMRDPLCELQDMSKKEECAFLAAEFLPELLRWAAIGRDGEPLQVQWPERTLTSTIEDPAIVPSEIIAAPRSRSMSIGSSRSASTTVKEDGKKQKKKGEVKEERPSGPAQDKTQNTQRTEGNQQHTERAAPPAIPRVPLIPPQTRHDSHPPLNPSGRNVVAHAPTPQPPKDNGDKTQWARGQAPLSQDVRAYKPSLTGAGTDNHGASTQQTSYTSPKAAHGLPSDGVLARSPHSTSSISSTSVQDPKIEQHGTTADVIPAVAGLIKNAKKWGESTSPAKAALSTPKEQKPANGSLSRQQQQQSQPTTPQQSPSITSPPKSTPEDVTPEQIQSKLVDSLAKNATAAEEKAMQQPTGQQQPPPVSPPSQHTVKQQPTMGTAAANEVRARRSLESVQLPVEQATVSEESLPVKQSQSEPQMSQTVEQQQVQVQSAGDPVYEELMGQMEGKGGDENRSIAPDPAEMNKLFTGSNKGQATLPHSLVAELEAEASAAAAATAAQAATQQLPVPALVAAAAADSSLNVTQPTPSSEFLVLPPDYGQSMQTYASSSDQGMLTPITEASQETFGTKSTALSESDAPGLADESTDTVFLDEPGAQYQAPLHVDVGEQPVVLPLQHQPQFSHLSSNPSELMTPNENNLCSDFSLSPGEATDHVFSPAFSLAHNQSIRSDATTAVQTTSFSMEVRNEAADVNQLHQSTVTPVSVVASVQSVDGQNKVAFVAESSTTSQLAQSGHETAQAPNAAPPEVVATVAPPMNGTPYHTGGIFQTPLPQKHAVAAPPSTSHQVPAVGYVEMSPVQQTPMVQQPHQLGVQQMPPVQSTQQIQTPIVQPPVMQQQQQWSVQQPQQPQQMQPVMTASVMSNAFEASTGVESMMTQPTSQSTTSVQSMNEQQHTTATPVSSVEQLSVDCREMNKLVTWSGVPYQCSPEEVATSMRQEAMQQQPVEQPQPSELDSILSMMDTPSAVTPGEVSDATYNDNQNTTSSLMNTSGGVRTITTDEIDAHAAMRRQEASELGEMASEIESSSAPHPFPVSYSMPPSIPSTALTTPDPNSSEQKFAYGDNEPVGGSEWVTTESPSEENSFGDEVSANSYSTTSMVNVNSQQMQMSPTVQLPSQPLTTANIAPPKVDIPTYVNPFEQVPQQQTMQQQHSGGGHGDVNAGAAQPSFGTVSSNVAPGFHTLSNPSGGQGGFVHGRGRGGRGGGGGGDRDRGARSGGRGGSRGGSGYGRGGGQGGSFGGASSFGGGGQQGGSSFGGSQGGSSFGGASSFGGGGQQGASSHSGGQDWRGGNSQHQPSGHGQGAAGFTGFESGDSGQQKSIPPKQNQGSYRGQMGSYRGSGGGGGATAGAAASGRGNRGFSG